MKARTLVYLSVLALVMGLTAFAEPDGDQPRGDQPRGDGAGDPRDEMRKLGQELQEKGYGRDKIREIFTKKRNGEALTAEEEEIAGKFQQIQQKFAARFGGDRRGGGRGGPARPASTFVKVKMNPLDAAYQALAETYFAAQKYVEAVDALKTMVGKSPDEETKNAAHFNAAQIYRQGLNYYSHAAEEYLKVKGTLRDRALREMVDMFQQANDAQLAIDTLTELANAATDVGDKVDILRVLAYAYSRSSKHDEAIETLKKIPELITYEQAVEMKDHYTPGDPPEVLQGRASMASPQMQGRWGRGDRGGQGFGGRRGGEGRPREQPAEQPAEK